MDLKEINCTNPLKEDNLVPDNNSKFVEEATDVVSKEIDSITDTCCEKLLNNLSTYSNPCLIEHSYNKDVEDNAEVADIEVWDNGNSCSDSDNNVAQNIEDFRKDSRLEESESVDEALNEMKTGLLISDEVCANSMEECEVEIDASGLIFMEEIEGNEDEAVLLEDQNKTAAEIEENSAPRNDAPKLGHKNDTGLEKIRSNIDNSEELRMNIKLQLSNLRMKKNTNIFQNFKKTEDTLISLNEKSTDSKCSNSNSYDKSDKSSDSNNKLPSTSKIYQNSDRPKKSVLNFQGIFSSNSETNKESTSTMMEADSAIEEDVPNVFNEIRKIIRKPKTLTVAAFAHMKEPEIKIASVVSLHDASKSEAEQFDSISKKLQSDNMGPSSSNTTSSPFISNSLDEFLNDAKLNVSYTIPKSGAEEGLTKDYSAVVIPVVPIENQIKEESNEAKEKSEYKPKTLAEKRRILEMNRKLEERQQKRMKKLQQQDIDFTVLKPMPLKTSYVLFKNKQYFVKTQSQRECIASIESKTDENSANDSTSPIKKPSLLKELLKKTYNVGYRPGPLSRKKALQIDASKWKTDLKFLPKVELEVIAEFGKPIHPNLVPYLSERNWEISDQRREFALTALAANSDSDSKPCVLTYPLKYERSQEIILVRKKILDSPAAARTEIDLESAKISQEVTKVLDNLLDYVEISEIASSLLKDDVDYDEPYTREVPVHNIQKKGRKRPFKKITKTNKELLRLNCKVLSMDLSEPQEEIDCTNAECLLGCICETLECATVIGAHCQKPKCMFKCSCAKRYHLSVDTVSRIEDQAKRNLAKEEKKFTQTVIYSNDRAIFVNTDKPRRAARMPKKYNDFLDDELNDWQLTISQCNKPCSVKLEKFDFSDIIPYCLSHKMYDCYCDGQNISNIVPVKIPEIPPSPPHKEQSHSQNQSSTTNVKKGKAYKRKGRYSHSKKKNKNTTTDNKLVLNQAESLKLELALRSSNSSNKQQEENETSKNNRRKQRLRVREEVSTVSSSSSSADAHPSEDNNDETDVNSNTIFPGEIVLNDPQWINALCKNDSKKPFKASVRILPWKALHKGFITKVINVFCIIEMPLKLVINIGKKLKNHKVIDIRTHPNYVLNFNLKGNSDWCIGKSETIRDMVKWLTTGNLPSKYNPLTLSFLLVEISTSGYYEVRGVCVQNTKNNSSLDSTIVEQQPNVGGKKSITNANIGEIKHTNMNGEIVSLYIMKRNYRLRELIEDGKEDDLSDNLYMWVGLPEVSRLAKWRVVFLFKDFMYLHFKDIDYSIKHSDLVKLTQISKESSCTLEIKNLKIRENHAHAAFAIYVSPKYSDRIFIGPYFINYDGEDIDTLKNMSGVLVSSESLNKIKGNEDNRCGHWMHERAYHIPKDTTKININEFIKSSEDEPSVPAVAKTEAAVPAVAVTEAAASSATTSKLGTESQSLSSSNSLLISKVKTVPSSSVPLPPLRKFDRILQHNGFSLRVQYCKPRAPADYNRFIITNIPHFGYLGAYQSANSHAIEVSWPFEEQVLIFENADNARDFLQDKFNQVLQPIPESFKIQVIVLVQLDLNDHNPINPAHLNMQCICGYFGTYNWRELSDKDCLLKIGMNKEEISLLIAKRNQALLGRKLVDLANVAGIKGTDGLNVVGVLEKSVKVIREQQKLQVENRGKIELLEFKADKSARRLFAMIKALPINMRSLESRILCDTVEIRPKKFRSNEIIEIPDDDSTTTTTTTTTTTEETATTSSTLKQYGKTTKRKSSLNNLVVSKPKIIKLENSNSATSSVLNISKISGNNEDLKTLNNSENIVIAIDDNED